MRTGPVKGSNPQKPVMVPVIGFWGASVPAGGFGADESAWDFFASACGAGSTAGRGRDLRSEVDERTRPPKRAIFTRSVSDAC